MRRATILPLLLLCACASQNTAVPVGPERTTTVTIETVNSSRELRLTPTRPVAHSAVALVPVDRAWQALPAVYAALGLSGAGIIDEEQRRFGAGPLTLPRRVNGDRVSKFLDCGATVSMPNADAYAVTVQVVTQLVGEGEAGTRVQTVMEAAARPRDTAGNTVGCTSTGQLEQVIAERLQAARQ